MVLDERACCLVELSPFSLYVKQSWQVKNDIIEQKLRYSNN